jgi:CheY-like chemotaxis protein
MASADVVAGPGEGHTPIILLVEDDVLVRFSTAELLRSEGYIVLEAVSASEALELLATGHPLDLVLSDVRMPGGMDGVSLTYAMKSVRPFLPIVLVSSHLSPNTSHAGDGFLAKPYSPDDLFKLVQEMIGTEWQTQSGDPAAF